jgi:hypothetical protein
VEPDVFDPQSAQVMEIRGGDSDKRMKEGKGNP